MYVLAILYTFDLDDTIIMMINVMLLLVPYDSYVTNSVSGYIICLWAS